MREFEVAVLSVVPEYWILFFIHFTFNNGFRVIGFGLVERHAEGPAVLCRPDKRVAIPRQAK